MLGDVIKKEWLYGVAIKLNQCQDRYDTLKDPKVTKKVFKLPDEAVEKSIEKPGKKPDAPVLYYCHRQV